MGDHHELCGAMHLGFYCFTTASFRRIKRRPSEKQSTVVSLTESWFFGPYPSLGRWLSFAPRRRSALVNKWEKLGRSLISTCARMNKSIQQRTLAPLIHELISHASMHITSKFVLNTMHTPHTHRCLFIIQYIKQSVWMNTNSCWFCIASSLAMGNGAGESRHFWNSSRIWFPRSLFSALYSLLWLLIGPRAD